MPRVTASGVNLPITSSVVTGSSEASGSVPVQGPSTDEAISAGRFYLTALNVYSGCARPRSRYLIFQSTDWILALSPTLVVIFSASLLLLSCGQKGDLIMPPRDSLSALASTPVPPSSPVHNLHASS
ncbi:LPS translocon maturation chaperone LptM [Allohahella sp. A8]|uniref:LPS translocon maturation chaperone LptM n=1 Tax=Allohahella sp. A8 TaxID=3141461 RepID=UPI003A801733